jgi:starch phosphorylase
MAPTSRFATTSAPRISSSSATTRRRSNAIRRAGHQSDWRSTSDGSDALKEALDRIDSGFFSPGERPRYHDIFNSLLHYGDHYLLLADYADYVATQKRVDALYLSPDEWQRKAILNVAGMGPFSADRTIRDYANDTWNLGTYLK